MKTSIFQNSNENIVRISALKFFVASLEHLGSFLGLPRDLVSNITKKEAYRKSPKASRKPQGSYKNFQGRNLYNIFVAILENRFVLKTNVFDHGKLWGSLHFHALQKRFSSMSIMNCQLLCQIIVNTISLETMFIFSLLRFVFTKSTII